MNKYLHSFRVILISGFLLFTFLPTVAKADQIVVLVDNQGHKIYVNTGETISRVEWMTRSFRPNPTAAPAAAPADIDKLVEQTASRFQVDPDLVKAVIRVESGFDAKAVSSKGAMGLMQLVPATAQRFGVANPFDPKQNIEGGVNYLKYLLDLFGGDLNLSLAAYNAGEHTVQRSGGIPAIPETQNYVRRVTSIYQTGDAPASGSSKIITHELPKAPITRYVDEFGVVHFTNVE
jgi:soluble lytic murein transglycosylase-like protein